MSDKHTPGPWNTFEYQCRSVIGVARQGDDSFTICEVNPDLESEQGYQIAEANARLIAAAPDLLEALKKIDALYTHWFDLADGSGVTLMQSSVAKMEAAHRAAEAAIARAEPQ
jgi:hypothetical protein